MRFSNLLKGIPFFSTLILIVLLFFSNQKDNTKLRLLIWNTPYLTLGSYLAISTSTGFIIAYSLTTYLAKLNKNKTKYQLNYKDNNEYLETNRYKDKPMNYQYDNTLIERDVKDPSPTVNAKFRIINGKDKLSNNFERNYDFDYEPLETEELNQGQPVKEKPINKVNVNSTDWSDQSFSQW